MPYTQAVFVNEHFYHIYNRGVAKQPIFRDTRDFRQAVLGLNYYRARRPPLKLSRFKQLSVNDRETYLNTKISRDQLLVEVIGYVLMPNHFHLLLRQIADNGISVYVSRFTNSFTRFFNTRHDRVGPLLQGTFKAIRVENDERLLHLSRYILIL